MSLADLGRSQAISGLTGNILQGQEGLLKTSMNMEEMVQRRRSQEIQDRLNTMKADEMQAEIARGNRHITKEDFMTRYPHKATAQYYWDQLSAGGYVDKIDVGGKQQEFFLHRDFKEISNQIEKEPQRQEGLLAAQITDMTTTENELYQQMQKATDKGDAEKAKQAKEQYDAIRSQKDNVFKAYQTLKGKGGAPIYRNVPGVGLVQMDPQNQTADVVVPSDQGDKSQSEEQLTKKAIGGDKESQAILDAMQKRKVAIAKAGASAQMEAKMEGLDLKSLSSSMKEGQMSSDHVRNAFGVPIQAKVETEVRKEYPKFDFVKNDANAKWQNNPGNQRTIAMIEGALPRVSRLVEQVNALGNTNIPKINEAMRLVARETGKPEYTNFEANRNAIVQEINTALSGSATGSDMRVRIELENIQSARSPAQIVGAINNLNEALLSRLDASLSVPFPMEVVKGTKTMDQYRSDIKKKYRRNFGSTEESGTTPTNVDLNKFWK